MRTVSALDDQIYASGACPPDGLARAHRRLRWKEWIVAVRIVAWLLRVIFVVNLILGILFFTNHALTFVELHMFLGIVFVAALWFLGAAQAFRGGPISIMVATFVVGLLLAIIGFVQRATGIQPAIAILHIIFFLAAIGLGEMSAARYRRLSAAAPAA
jgi:hypothetical protein